MWLPIMLLAVMASGSACPDFCQCHAPVIECRGSAPNLAQLDQLSPNFTEFLLNNIEHRQLDSYAGKTPRSTFLQLLQVIQVTNCSNLRDTSQLMWDLVRVGDTQRIASPNIRTLNVSYNMLEAIPWREIVDDNRTDYNLRVLDASYNRLRSIASKDPREMRRITWLSLAGNNLKYLHPNEFRDFESLEYLDLSNNDLDIAEGTFDTLKSLQKLNLAGNKLRRVQANWFQNLGKLIELDVSRSRLLSIPADTLQLLASLSVLKMSENPLIERDFSLLLGTGRRLEIVDASRTGLVRVPAALTRSVRTLRLAGNQLTSINSGDMDSYPLLRVLDLSNNRLMIIEEDALGRLDGLEILALSRNILPTVPRSLPSGLKMLDLKQNAISKLSPSDLQGLYLLEELDLSGNVISSIEGGSFRQLPVLQTLDISDNPIKKLPSDTLSGPSNLAILRMSGLMSLETEANQNQDTAFPMLTPERLVTLDVSRSPSLAAQLLADNAAIAACKSLQELDLSFTNTSTMRSDLPYKLPQLQTLNLIGNEWNCKTDQFWLGEWIRKHVKSIIYSARCSTPPELEGRLLQELPRSPDNQESTSESINAQLLPTTSRILEERNIIDHKKIPEEYEQLKLKKAMNDMEAVSTQKTITEGTKTTFTLIQKITTQQKLTSSSESMTVTQSFPKTESTTLYSTTKISSSTEKPVQPIIATQEEWSKLTRIQNIGVSTPKTTHNQWEKSSPTSSNIIGQQRLSTKSSIPNSNTSDDGLSPKSHTPITTNSPAIQEKSGKISSPSSGITRRVNDNNNTVARSNQPGKMDLGMVRESKRTNEEAQVTSDKRAENSVISELSRSKLLLERSRFNDEPKSIAEELNSQATESGARTSETLATGAHPGMLVLLGAAIGAVAAMTVVLSRRASAKRRDRQYLRHENIEVHALTPTTELW